MDRDRFAYDCRVVVHVRAPVVIVALGLMLLTVAIVVGPLSAVVLLIGTVVVRALYLVTEDWE